MDREPPTYHARLASPSLSRPPPLPERENNAGEPRPTHARAPRANPRPCLNRKSLPPYSAIREPAKLKKPPATPTPPKRSSEYRQPPAARACPRSPGENPEEGPDQDHWRSAKRKPRSPPSHPRSRARTRRCTAPIRREKPYRY